MKSKFLIAFLPVLALPVFSHAQQAGEPLFTPDDAVQLAQAGTNELRTLSTPRQPPAQPVTQPVSLPTRASLDAYTSAHHLTGGFGDWREAGVRGSYETGAHRWQAEFATMRRFRETGQFVAIGDTITFDNDWFGSLSLGAGDGAFYLPRYRIDSFINRKFLPGRNLIGTLGAGYYRAPDGHTDVSKSVGATYYFDQQPLVVQGEIRFNDSSPGNIRTHQQFVAATWGSEKQTQVTGRLAWGSEGYQTITSAASLINFRSNEASVKVRHWIGPLWGVEARVERYRNPFYVRTGANVGLFWQFQ